MPIQQIDLKEPDWRSSVAKAKAMDWFIRHRVAGKSSVAVDNYVKNFARTLARWRGIPARHCVKNYRQGKGVNGKRNQPELSLHDGTWQS